MARKPKSLQQIAWESETEDQFQTWLVDVARLKGWKVHFWPDWMRRAGFASLKKQRRRGDRPWPDPGFPDVWCVHEQRGQLVVFECKRETARASRVSPEQHMWLGVLTSMHVPNYVVRPSDRDMIERILDGKDIDVDL